MPAEPGAPIPCDLGSVNCLRLVIPADTLAVRDALVRMCDTLVLRSLPEDERGTAEIVLAEVLNNIVEHAYATDGGEIEIKLCRAREGLICEILDRGREMPESRMPAGRLPVVTDGNLPEGGFGWHLIRTLSQDLDYSRLDGRNRLTFRLGPSPAAGQCP